MVLLRCKKKKNTTTVKTGRQIYCSLRDILLWPQSWVIHFCSSLVGFIFNSTRTKTFETVLPGKEWDIVCALIFDQRISRNSWAARCGSYLIWKASSQTNVCFIYYSSGWCLSFFLFIFAILFLLLSVWVLAGLFQWLIYARLSWATLQPLRLNLKCHIGESWVRYHPDFEMKVFWAEGL